MLAVHLAWAYVEERFARGRSAQIRCYGDVVATASRQPDSGVAESGGGTGHSHRRCRGGAESVPPGQNRADAALAAQQEPLRT